MSSTMMTPCLQCGLGSPEDSGNSSSCDTRSLVFTSLFAVCGITTTFSNVVNLFALRIAKESFSENTRISFQLIAVVDFFVGLFCCTFHAIRCSNIPITYPKVFSIGGVVLCSTLFNQSIMILACISIDRYIAITRPLRYYTILTKQRMISLLALGMLIGTLNSLSSLVHKVIIEADDLTFASRIIAIYPIHIVYFIPIIASAIITAFCNISMIRIARKHRSAIRDAQNLMNRGRSERNSDADLEGVVRRNKDLSTVLAVTGMFYLTWGAQISAYVISAMTKKMLPCFASNLLLILAISNSFWNVLLYLLIKPSFRQNVLQLIVRR